MFAMMATAFGGFSLKTYLVEVFDNRDQYGGGMPCLQFEATCRREAYETIFECLGININIKEESI